jgi:hypothetical protein
MGQNEPSPCMLENANFRWWLQWAQNGCRLRRQSQRRADGSIVHFLFFILPSGTGVRFQSMHDNTWQVKVYGERIYHVLEQALHESSGAGAPAPEDYTLIVDGQPFLTVGGHHFPVGAPS